MQNNQKQSINSDSQYIKNNALIHSQTLFSYPEFPSFTQSYPFYQLPFNNFQNFQWFYNKNQNSQREFQNQEEYMKASQSQLIQQTSPRKQYYMQSQNTLNKKSTQEQKLQRKDTCICSVKIQQDPQQQSNESFEQIPIQSGTKSNNKFNKLQKQINKYQITDDILEEDDPELAEIIQELIIFILDNYNESDEFLNKFRTKFVKDSCTVWKKSFGPLFSSRINELFKILVKKFQKFKKTKEEMVKYIFRRAYNFKNKPSYLPESQYKTSVAIHNKNLSDYKSMNSRFIQREFQNPYFLLLFENFMECFDSNFEEQNAERIRRLRKIILEDYRNGDFNLIQNQKKLAWTSEYKVKIKQICHQYKRMYQSGKFIQKVQNSVSIQKAVEQTKKLKRTTRRKY